MIQGTPQDQIPDPSSSTPVPGGAIPMQAVDTDQLPRERGLKYDEVATIVGSLYLDSHHMLKVREDQFQAMAEEYERQVLQAQAEVAGKQREVESLVKEVAQLRRELELLRNGRQRQEPRPSSPSSDDGDHPLPDNG